MNSPKRANCLGSLVAFSAASVDNSSSSSSGSSAVQHYITTKFLSGLGLREEDMGIRECGINHSVSPQNVETFNLLTSMITNNNLFRPSFLCQNKC